MKYIKANKQFIYPVYQLKIIVHIKEIYKPIFLFFSKVKVFEKMHAKLGGSVMIISHQERILNIADRIIVISAGTVKADGVKADILPDLLGTVNTGCRVTAGNDKEDCL